MGHSSHGRGTDQLVEMVWDYSVTFIQPHNLDNYIEAILRLEKGSCGREVSF